MTADVPPVQPDAILPVLPGEQGSIRRDVLSSYVLTASRLIAWAGVSAIVYRQAGAEAFALIALLRGTITLVNYSSLGIGPAIARMLTEALYKSPKLTAVKPTIPEISVASPGAPIQVLAYERPAGLEELTSQERFRKISQAGDRIASNLFLIACVVSVIYGLLVNRIHITPYLLTEQAVMIVMAFGVGTAFRVLSEPFGAVLQATGRVWQDNLILACAEIVWLLCYAFAGWFSPASAAAWWLAAMIGVAIARNIAKDSVARRLYVAGEKANPILVKQILLFGSALVLAQLADFLYAPTDYILINRLLSPEDVAVYAPLVQIDSALLLLVAGPATALFPHFAIAHAGADHRRLRRLYLLATGLSAAALLAAGLVLLLLSPMVFRLWLGTELPASQALLPLILIHTIIGGSSAVGRSILLGMGKVKALTASALIAGGANVILSALLASVGGLGLKGIVLGTVIVVVARCAIWMPWYVWRETGKGNA